MKTVNFDNSECTVVFGEYEYGGRAIQLFDAQTGEPVATATVCVPEVSLGTDEVLIKDYSENAGLLAALRDAGIVEPTGETIPVGFAEVHRCRLIA